MQMNAKRDTPKRRATSTKTGPGRRHVSGSHKFTPIVQRGAPLGFEQRVNPKRQEARALFIKEHGVRQWKRQQRFYAETAL